MSHRKILGGSISNSSRPKHGVHYSNIPVRLDAKSISNLDPWRDDLYKRKEYADQLCSLLRDQEHSVVLTLDGAWGSGKSFFLKRWCADLTNAGQIGVYFNAWQDDFLADPLVSIIGQLNKALEVKAKENAAKWRDIVAAGKTVFAKAGLAVVAQCLKHYTGVDFSEIKVEDVESRNERIQKIYTNLIESRESLLSGIEKLSSSIYSKTGSCLVFVVDELDRCRPTYAIETIERIKHLFDVPHVAFVIGVDKQQLMESVKAVYGNIDARQYLLRFFDLEFHLPAPDRTAFLKSLWERYQIEEYFEKKNIDIALRSKLRNARRCIAYLAKMHSFTLRELETLFKSFVLVLRSIRKSSELDPMLLAALLMLRVLNSRIYEEWINGLCPVRDVVNVIIPTDRVKSFPLFFDLVSSIFLTHYKSSASIAAPTNSLISFLKEHPKKEYKGPVPICFTKLTKKEIGTLINKMDDRIEDDDFANSRGIRNLRYIASKIDFMVVELRENKGLKDGVTTITESEKKRAADLLR